MDRDLWLSSSSSALGAVLATQSDVDDVLLAAMRARPAKRRSLARAQRRLRKLEAAEQHAQVAAEPVRPAGHRQDA